MSALTPADCETLRQGVMNAVAEVSEAENEGLIGMFKEGRASTKALKALPEPLLEAVTGDYTTPDDYQDPADDTMESYLRAALAVVDAKTPHLRAEFAVVVMDACRATADAAKGTSDAEREVLDRVAAVLA